MSTQVQFRRGTTTDTSIFTGAIGEVTVDTTKNVCVVHDGLTVGGYPLLRQDLNNIPSGAITGTMIASNTVQDTNIIAVSGTKVTPSFGSQNVLTSGSITGGSISTAGSVSGGSISATGGGTISTTGTVSGGTISSTGSVSDSLGNIRILPQNSQTTGYTLVASDTGKHISITTGGVTVPSAIFSAGAIVTIFNNSASNQTITQGASVTMRLAGSATTGNRTLAQYGVATVLCVASNTFVISGSGLT